MATNVKVYIENLIKQLKPVERFNERLLRVLNDILNLINQNIKEVEEKRKATVVDKLKPWSSALAKVVEKEQEKKS